MSDDAFSPKNPDESRAQFDASLERIRAEQRREQRIRYAAVLVGVLIIVAYLIIGALTGLWGLGLLIMPFSIWLIMIGVMALIAAYFAEHS